MRAGKKKKRSWNRICSRLWKTPWRTGWEIYIARRGAGGLSLIQSWSPVFLCLISRHVKSFVLNLRYLRYQCNKSRDKKKKKKRLQVSSKERGFIFTITAHDGVAFLRQGWDVTQIPLARHFLPLWDIWAVAKLGELAFCVELSPPCLFFEPPKWHTQRPRALSFQNKSPRTL